MESRQPPVAHPDVTVQDIIDWAAQGLAFMDRKQYDEDPEEQKRAKIVIPILIGLIATCEGKDSVEAIKECMVCKC